MGALLYLGVFAAGVIVGLCFGLPTDAQETEVELAYLEGVSHGRAVANTPSDNGGR
jgi:hypothetical protein